jgi:hypothetical protein
MQSVAIIVLCTLAAVAYGIVHDQVTARVCVEYFTIGHPPVFHTNSPTQLGLGWGVLATWWVGVLLGVPLAFAARFGAKPKRSALSLVRPVTALLAVNGACALLAGCIGYIAASKGWVRLVGRLATAVPDDRHVVFLADLWAHWSSYLVGFVGGIVVCVLVWIGRRRVSPTPSDRRVMSMARAASVMVVLLGACLTVYAEEPTDTPPLVEEPLTEADRGHWAFTPLVRNVLPPVNDARWVRNPIDRFILARLERSGLQPMPPADRATLLRRVTFDLTGLPPTPAELVAFLADASPDAWERAVERLLDSSAYGEHWAQHWLDVARFAETDGFEHDLVRPEAWRYRDWVIEAFNHDMPYDEFVRLQVAGDKLRPGDAAAAVATGFLLAGPDMPDLNLQEERRHNVLNEMTATVGAVFLGLQIGCAQCHDHKFDPISQADFYRLRALFEDAEFFKPNPLGRVMQEAPSPTAPSRIMVRGDFRRPGATLEPGYPRIANPWCETVPAHPEGNETGGRRVALARWLTQPDHPLATRVIVNRLWQAHFGRGLVATPSDFGFMGSRPTHSELLDWLAAELPAQGWSLKRMHRLIVNSATYRQASRPALPEWSAGETEAARVAWQRSMAADPDNELLARMGRRRLEGEAIRDAMLAAADSLTARRGGQGVMPPLPDELVHTLLKGQWQVNSDEEDHRRRSIYLFARRNLRYPLFEAFDRPDALASCARRDRSTTAPQGLYLLNSEFSLVQARRLAGYVLGHTDGLEAQIDLCYRRLLSRAPTAEELASSRNFLFREASRLRTESHAADELPSPLPAVAGVDPYSSAALVELCLAMFNLNEFIYVD